MGWRAELKLLWEKGRYNCSGDSMGKNVTNRNRNEFVRYTDHDPSCNDFCFCTLTPQPLGGLPLIMLVHTARGRNRRNMTYPQFSQMSRALHGEPSVSYV